MANFHFFTDSFLVKKTAGEDPSDQQKRHLPFGALVSSVYGLGVQSSQKYNVSSMHFSDGVNINPSFVRNPYAYAVCDGQIFVHILPNSNNELADIILKPSVHAEVNPRIKYFIYKNVLLRSIATPDSTGILQINASDDPTNPIQTKLTQRTNYMTKK